MMCREFVRTMIMNLAFIAHLKDHVSQVSRLRSRYPGSVQSIMVGNT